MRLCGNINLNNKQKMYNRNSYKGKKDISYKRRNTINEINSREEIYSNNYYNTSNNNYTNTNSWHNNVSFLNK